jgi:hypothetical protein
MGTFGYNTTKTHEFEGSHIKKKFKRLDFMLDFLQNSYRLKKL